MSRFVATPTACGLALLLIGCSSTTVVNSGSGGSGGGSNGKCVVEAPFIKARADDNGHCFALDQQTVTFDVAESVCVQWHGHLASITTKQEQNFVATFLTDSTSGTGMYYVWNGLKRSGGKWSWADGQAYNYNAFPTPPPSGDGCVQMLRVAAWSWDLVSDCSQPNNFVCER